MMTKNGRKKKQKNWIMLVEFRIVMPLSVEEYRRAQLYMVAKFSREQSSHGEGITVLANRPYSNSQGLPHTKGQFTHKVVHLGPRLPSFLTYLLPTSILQIDERSHNAYPCTRSQYSIPYCGDKFRLDIFTKYFDDCGDRDNVHVLSDDDLARREVVYVDVVTDEIGADKYKESEDPMLFRSEKTGRGPLKAGWQRRGDTPVMCCYKLCHIDFKYFGLQTRVEQFIAQRAIRDTVTLSHRQAYCWIDEWYDLSIGELRAFEKKTNEQLDAIMNGDGGDDCGDGDGRLAASSSSASSADVSAKRKKIIVVGGASSPSSSTGETTGGAAGSKARNKTKLKRRLSRSGSGNPRGSRSLASASETNIHQAIEHDRETKQHVDHEAIAQRAQDEVGEGKSWLSGWW
jgi:Phosphatidylinositol transfer protein